MEVKKLAKDQARMKLEISTTNKLIQTNDVRVRDEIEALNRMV